MIDSSGLKKLAVFVTALPMREMQCSLCRKRKKKKKIEVAHKSRTHDFPNTERMPSMPKYKKVSRRATPFTRLALTGDLHAARTCNVQSLPYGMMIVSCYTLSPEVKCKRIQRSPCYKRGTKTISKSHISLNAVKG